MKCVVLCSGNGGTGKSCVAAYTGAALAKAGQRTLLLELGAGARSLDLIVGVQDQVVYTVDDVLSGACALPDAVLGAAIQPGLSLLPGPLEKRPPLAIGKIESLLKGLAASYDYVLVDSVDTAAFPVTQSDLFLLVLKPDSLSVRAAAAKSRELFAAGARDIRIVINEVPAQVSPIVGVEDFDDIIDQIGAGLMGIVPASPKLQYCSNNAKPLDVESLTVQVFDNLAGRLMGQRRPLLIR